VSNGMYFVASQSMLKARVIITQIAVIVAILAAWESAVDAHWIAADILPPPSTVMVTLGGLLRSTDFLANAGDTLVRVLAAFAIGAPLALLVGFIMGENITIGKSFSPIFNLVLAVPQSIFLPIFALVFGLGFTEKLMFGITHVFFVVAVSTMAAVHQVSHAHVIAARSFGATRLRIWLSIYLPAMAPHVITGLRVGMIFNIIGILLAEMYASQSGLGMLLLRWSESYEVNQLMAATIFISVVTILINEAMRLWEAGVGRWQSARMAE
jgi:ABC-type nitrate/sulfonate/bicarbonate transport system permease component